MTMDSKFDLSDLPILEDKKEEEEKVVEKKKKPIVNKKPAPKKVVREPVKLITFDRWFISLGKPLHHKAGMMAFKSTKGKKTEEAWYKLFEAYGLSKPETN